MPDIDDPREARATFRKGDYARQTAGIAPRYVQGNVCIVPIGSALDFASFCQRNSKPCPLIGTGSPGDPTLPELGEIDIRTDLPRYSVFKDGKLVDEPTDIRKYWANDLVTFVLGCSIRVADSRSRHPAAAYRARDGGTDVSHQQGVRAGRALQREHGGFNAANASGGCYSRYPDNITVPGGSRGSGTHWSPRGNRRARHQPPRFRRSARNTGTSTSSILGLRSNTTGSTGVGKAAHLHYTLSWVLAHYRQAQRFPRSSVARADPRHVG
jgi:hypothetical protein